MEKFLFITHDNVDPAFNLASEEYLLKQKGGYYIYLWKNAPSVIVGINQNTLEEVNLDFTEKNGIKVIRRLTGGGAVYHDLQNLCYTVIAPFDESVNNYKKFTMPVIEYLNSLGINAEFSGRNDITVDGKKISGNAETVYNGKVMHHGTLLFNTDMSVLSGALKPSKLKIESKGIKSVRARVTNIYQELPQKITIDQFKEGLKSYFASSLEEYTFSKEDLVQIEKLVKEKYSTYDWNIGYSPKGKNCFREKFPFGIINITFDTKDGKIENAEIFGDFFSKKDVRELAKNLNGTTLSVAALSKALENVGDYIQGATGEEIVKMIF